MKKVKLAVFGMLILIVVNIIDLLKSLNREGRLVIIVTHDEETKNQVYRRTEL